MMLVDWLVGIRLEQAMSNSSMNGPFESVCSNESVKIKTLNQSNQLLSKMARFFKHLNLRTLRTSAG